MRQVVFITPNTQGRFSDAALGTLQLATILDKHGIDCEILPFFRCGELTDLEAFLDGAIAALAQRSAKIVSFYTRCDTYHIVLKLAQRIKERWPDIYVVLGGPQSDITAEETIRQIPYVDYICCGEGETTVVPFFSSLLQNAPDTTVAGLVYRENGAVKVNPRPALLKDLDTLPMLDFSFLPLLENAENTKDATFPVDVGRGCPFGCTYCSTNSFWGRKFRLKSPQRIVAEVKQFHEQFGATVFSFSHDMFTLNRNSVIETCRLLRELDFPVKWHCSARLDCIDRELIDIMTASGMNGMYIGIETGSPRMQKCINKNLDLSNALPLISYLIDKGCKIVASFIFGFPEETEEDLCQTMRLIAELLPLKNISIQTHLCTFLAGTELSRRHLAEMTRAEQYSDITGNCLMEQCSDLIEAHPQLFQHLLEYKTPLRTRLRYFPLFFQMWQQMLPVYQYLSEKYPAHRLLDMYDDFVSANADILDSILQLPQDRQCYALAKDDRFPRRFQNDAYYSIIKDIYRYRIWETDAPAESCEVFCFSPTDLKKKIPLQEYRRCLAMVRRKDGKATVSIVANS